MGIVGGLFWVVFGVIYVVYRIYKEDKYGTLSVLTSLAVLIIPPIIGALIIYIGDTNIITTIIGIAFYPVGLILLAILSFREKRKLKESPVIEDETDFQYQTKLERLQDDELERLLGCPLNKIPLNPNKHKNDADSQRRGLAIKEIMRENGRTYSYQFRPWMGDSTNYPQDFLAFVNEYKKNSR